MQRSGLALLLLLLLPLACTQEPRVPDQEPVVLATDDLPQVQQLLPPGEYRVAGADGAEVDLGHAITVSVSEDTIAVTSQCVTPRWKYTYEAGRLATKPIIVAMCDRGREPAEVAVEAVFDQPEVVLRTPENGIHISGGGHELTLFSQ